MEHGSLRTFELELELMTGYKLDTEVQPNLATTVFATLGFVSFAWALLQGLEGDLIAFVVALGLAGAFAVAGFLTSTPRRRRQAAASRTRSVMEEPAREHSPPPAEEGGREPLPFEDVHDEQPQSAMRE